ncbi:MAG: ArsR/SmtB family transcription factor [Terriglobia bacterium]
MELSLAQPQELFAVLGERLRLRLACCLLTAKEGLCVCELVDALQVSQPNASRHLKLMKAAGLVEERRDARWVYYRLKHADHPFFNNIRCCIDTVCCCVDVQDDLRRLRARLKLRRRGKCVVGIRVKKRPA